MSICYFRRRGICFKENVQNVFVFVLPSANIPTNQLTNKTARSQWVDQQIDSVTSGFLDGINVDFEAPILRNETDISKGFSALFEELYQRLKAKYNGYMVRIILAFYANLAEYF